MNEKEAIERRDMGAKIELRAAKEGTDSPGTLSGYAAMFGTMSEDLGGFVETIEKGTFADSIARDDIRCLRNHEPDILLGRNSNGTLRLREDDLGMHFECDLPNTTHGRDTAEMIKRGDMSGCSFSFKVDSYAWDFDAEPPVRSLRKVKLFDAGPVTYPAYRDTSVACRSLDASRPPQVDPLALHKAKLKLAGAF